MHNPYIIDYKNHFMEHKNLLLVMRDISLEGGDLDDDDDDEISQLFIDAIDDIYNSFNISDEDLINDSILHMTQLIRDTKKKQIFDNCSNIDTLKLILMKFFDLDLNSVISRSLLEMIAFLSSTKLLAKTEILYQEQFFQYIINAIHLTRNPNLFIILSNFSLEREENARKCFALFPPQFFKITCCDNGCSNLQIPDSNSDFMSQKEFFCLSVLSLLSSYCNYNLDENATLEVLTNIKELIYLNEGRIRILNELFYALSRFRLSCQCCIQKANEINLLECFSKIRCNLNSEIIVTIFQYYGDSILQNYKIPELDIEKLMKYASSKDKMVSGAAMWLIWTYLNDDQNSQNDSIQKFYTNDFFELMREIIDLNESLANTKITLLVLSMLIEKANSNQIGTYVTNEIINLIFDCDFIESDDQQVVFHIILALNCLLNHFCASMNNEFFEFLKSKLNNLTLCDFDDEYRQELAENCSAIMSCFN